MAKAIYNPNTNKVQTFIADDSGYIPESPYILVPEAELPEGWEMEPPPLKTWSNVEFYRRFTMQEKVMFEAACLQSPLLAALKTTLTIEPLVWEGDQNFQLGMTELVTYGILTEQRKQEILS